MEVRHNIRMLMAHLVVVHRPRDAAGNSSSDRKQRMTLARLPDAARSDPGIDTHPKSPSFPVNEVNALSADGPPTQSDGIGAAVDSGCVARPDHASGQTGRVGSPRKSARRLMWDCCERNRGPPTSKDSIATRSGVVDRARRTEWARLRLERSRCAIDQDERRCAAEGKRCARARRLGLATRRE